MSCSQLKIPSSTKNETFSNCQIDGLTFSNKTYEGCTFEKVEFKKCLFKKMTFDLCTFKEVKFVHCKSIKTVFEQCYFFNSYVFGSKFYGTVMNVNTMNNFRFYNSIFTETEFNQCDFYGTIFENSNFLNTKLYNVIFVSVSMINMNFEHSYFNGIYFEYDVDIQKTSFEKCKFVGSDFGSPRITNTNFGNSHFGDVIFTDDSNIAVSSLEIDGFNIIANHNKQGKLSDIWKNTTIPFDAEDMENDDDKGIPYGIPNTALSTGTRRKLPFISRSYDIDGVIDKFPIGSDIIQYKRPTRQISESDASRAYKQMEQQFNDDYSQNTIKFSRELPDYRNTRGKIYEKLYKFDVDVADDVTAFLPSGKSVPLFSYLEKNPDYVAFTFKNQSSKDSEYNFSLVSKSEIDKLNMIQSKMDFKYEHYNRPKIKDIDNVLIYPYMRTNETRNVYKAVLDLESFMIKSAKEKGYGHLITNDPKVIFDTLATGQPSLRLFSLNEINKFVYPYFGSIPNQRLFAIGYDSDEILIDIFRFKNGHAEYSNPDSSFKRDHYDNCILYHINLNKKSKLRINRTIQQPTKPTQQTQQPTRPTQPTQTQQPTQPTRPTQTQQPTQPTRPTQPTQTQQPTRPAQPTQQPTRPTQPTQTQQPTQHTVQFYKPDGYRSNIDMSLAVSNSKKNQKEYRDIPENQIAYDPIDGKVQLFTYMKKNLDTIAFLYRDEYFIVSKEIIKSIVNTDKYTIYEYKKNTLDETPLVDITSLMMKKTGRNFATILRDTFSKKTNKLPENIMKEENFNFPKLPKNRMIPMMDLDWTLFYSRFKNDVNKRLFEIFELGIVVENVVDFTQMTQQAGVNGIMCRLRNLRNASNKSKKNNTVGGRYKKRNAMRSRSRKNISTLRRK